MPRWLRWTGIGCGGFILLGLVVTVLSFLFSNSFWVFLVSLLVALVISTMFGKGEQGQGNEQPEGLASTIIGILVVITLVFGVTAAGKAISRAVSGPPPEAKVSKAHKEAARKQAPTPLESTASETTTPATKDPTGSSTKRASGTTPKRAASKAPEKKPARKQAQLPAPPHPESKPKQASAPTPAPAPMPSRPRPRNTPGKIVTVSRVVDGDTVHVSPAINGNDGVRIIGIDTPETHKPGCAVQPYGPEASSYATSVLEGKTVRIELGQETTDQYGRLLGYVWLSSSDMFNEDLVSQGYAQAYPYPPNTKYAGRFASDQARARAAGLGIWGLTPGQQALLADRGNGIGSDSCVSSASSGSGQQAGPTPAPTPQPAPSAPAAPSSQSGLPPYPGGPESDRTCAEVGGGPYGVPPGSKHDRDGDGAACE